MAKSPTQLKKEAVKQMLGPSILKKDFFALNSSEKEKVTTAMKIYGYSQSASSKSAGHSKLRGFFYLIQK